METERTVYPLSDRDKELYGLKDGDILERIRTKTRHKVGIREESTWGLGEERLARLVEERGDQFNFRLEVGKDPETGNYNLGSLVLIGTQK